MKKAAACIAGIILALCVVYFVGSGFIKNASAFIEDYTVSADGNAITIKVGVSFSMGYIRNVTVHQQSGGKLYLDCYSAFGGLNGHIGAQDTFTFPLDDNTTIIAIYRNTNCYEEVLRKDESGSWQRASQ